MRLIKNSAIIPLLLITVTLPVPAFSSTTASDQDSSPAQEEMELTALEVQQIKAARLNRKKNSASLEAQQTKAGQPAHKENFPIPAGLRKNVDFWINVYTEYDTSQVVIHDSWHLDIIYTVLKFPKAVDANGGYVSRSMRRKVKRERRKYKKLLRSIHYKNKSKKKLTAEEKTITALFASVSAKNKFLTAARNVRSQLGQKDRFLEGIKKSGRYIDEMKEIFRNEGLPEELTVIPHIESSFNYKAYSSARAVGVWQFMRSTARRYMKVNYVIDERRDPIIATKGAAKLLKNNYKKIGNWPMAITAYNHGLGGMKRAKRKFGDNMAKVVDKYRSRSFGFASRNFYCEFLAALEIIRNTSKYFGEVTLYPPLEYDTLQIKRYIRMDTLSRYLKLDKKKNRDMNLALRRPVFESRKLIPKGYMLKIPKPGAEKLKELYASIPLTKQKDTQKHSDWYRVRKGDTLYHIARRFRTTVSSLMDVNNIDNVHRLYAGQVLRMPGAGNKAFTKQKKETRQVKQYSKKKRKPAEKKVLANVQGFSKKLYEVLTPSPANAENLQYGFITVEPEETLGHYSEWCGTRASVLRRLNGIRGRRRIIIGQKLKIPFSMVSRDSFEEKRAEYHLGLQEDYFSTYKIQETMAYTMARGDTVWNLALENDVPLWLLKRYNPGINFRKLLAGDTLDIPVTGMIN